METQINQIPIKIEETIIPIKISKKILLNKNKIPPIAPNANKQI